MSPRRPPLPPPPPLGEPVRSDEPGVSKRWWRGRNLTRDEFYAWAERGEAAVARRWGWRAARPLTDNPVYLYFLSQAARGRVPEGDPTAPEWRAFQLLSAMFGMSAGDTVKARVTDHFVEDMLVSDLSPDDFADGLVGYLLIGRRDMPRFFANRAVVAARWFSVAIPVAFAVILLAVASVRESISPWDLLSKLIARLSDPFHHFGSSVVLLLVLASLFLWGRVSRRRAVSWMTCSAASSILTTKAGRKAYLARLGPLERVGRWAGIGVMGTSKVMVNGTSLPFVLWSQMLRVVAVVIGIGVAVWIHEDLTRLLVRGWRFWTAVIVGFWVAAPLALAADARFHQIYPAREFLLRVIRAWRAAGMSER